jgi:response regulator RpfG family c-di-GMP phosphodiesterase
MTMPRRKTAGPDEGSDGQRRVMVVDDNPDSAETMAELVKIWGYDVRTAHDGPGALDCAPSTVPGASGRTSSCST